METVAEFNDNHGFNVRLTNEKIFIDAAGSSETIALRGLNGVGLYDNIEKYNKELVQYKTDGKGAEVFKWIFLVLAGIILIIGFPNSVIPAIIVAGIAIGISKLLMNKNKEPILDSYFRLMLSGGDRKFKFNKSDETSVKIADFINKVEDTLTAYK